MLYTTQMQTQREWLECQFAIPSHLHGMHIRVSQRASICRRWLLLPGLLLTSPEPKRKLRFATIAPGVQHRHLPNSYQQQASAADKHAGSAPRALARADHTGHVAKR